MLPAGMDILSASASQGTWTNDGPVVAFELGTVSNRRPAHVVLSARPVYPGGETNLVTVFTNAGLASLDTFDPDPTNNQTALLVTVLADHDGDSMADLWETAHGLDHADPLDADADADGDGFTNRREYEFGTDPRDPLSMVRVTQVEVRGTDVHVSFPTVSGRRYELQTVTDPTVQPLNWTPLPGSIVGDGGMATIIHAGGLSPTHCFYRIVVGL
jgi:hypothetical protein